jgi:pyrroline-5-carboxylate reductase
MKISDYRLGFIGFGHMAQVIFRAIDKAKLISRSQITFVRRDRDKIRQNEKEYGITATSLETICKESDILLLCVRPNQADAVLKEMAHLKLDPSKMILSVLAGLHLAHYQKHLKSHPLARIMPNIASEVAEGMSVFTFAPHSSIEFKSLTHLLFSAMGEVIEVSESMMDISTAIAGSGPGFVFRLIEAMAKEGEKQGLEYAKALKMAAQTFAGAGKLILKGANPEKLLHQIATPNGVTEAGLKVMSQSHIDHQFQAVIQASAKRSKELSESP